MLPNGRVSILYCLVLSSNHYHELPVTPAVRPLLTMPIAMDENRFSFSIHELRSLTNVRIVSVYGDYQYTVEIANFNIYNMYWKLTD